LDILFLLLTHRSYSSGRDAGSIFVCFRFAFLSSPAYSQAHFRASLLTPQGDFCFGHHRPYADAILFRMKGAGPVFCSSVPALFLFPKRVSGSTVYICVGVLSFCRGFCCSTPRWPAQDVFRINLFSSSLLPPNGARRRARRNTGLTSESSYISPSPALFLWPGVHCGLQGPLKSTVRRSGKTPSLLFFFFSCFSRQRGLLPLFLFFRSNNLFPLC